MLVGIVLASLVCLIFQDKSSGGSGIGLRRLLEGILGGLRHSDNSITKPQQERPGGVHFLQNLRGEGTTSAGNSRKL